MCYTASCNFFVTFAIKVALIFFLSYFCRILMVGQGKAMRYGFAIFTASVMLLTQMAATRIFGAGYLPSKTPSVAFYYGSGSVPSGLLDFRWLVVNPGKSRLPGEIPAGHGVFAYASIGETIPGDPAYKNLPSGCAMGTDPNWGGTVINLAKPVCREYVLNRVIDPAWKEGYRGFFLDTLDSYRLAAKSPSALQMQQQGLVRMIRAINVAHPDARLIANRGFSVLPEIHQDLVAVAAESLFRQWNPATKTYSSVPVKERKALVRELRGAQGFGLPTIAIDYLPARLNRQGWWQDAQKIRKLGFVPYVTDTTLTAVGAGLVEPMPRSVAVFYSGSSPEQAASAFAEGAMPLEYLGYVPRFYRLSRVFPALPKAGEYAGVVLWSDGDPIQNRPELSHWLLAAKEQGIPILMLGDFQGDLDSQLYQHLGMVKPESETAPSLTAEAENRAVGYEIPVTPDSRDFLKFRATAGSTVWLRLENSLGDREDAAAVTPWGGYVLSPYLLTTLPNRDNRWEINPFRLYRDAFRLPPIPVPDTTTESGRRLFMAQADGDGFLSRAQFPPYHIAGEVYMHRILERYRLPFTGSVIVGDLLPGKRGLYPALAPLGIRVARKIFRLPYVEIGSHMWSHPFSWPAIEAGKNFPGISLPVPGYHFSPYMEAVGAATWIDGHLAPAGKRVVIDQWSGDCEPDAQVVGLAYGAGLQNINGGETTISHKNPSITAVPPIGIFRGKWLQVFAPDANEDYYTNQWHGPYWGYQNVIQTFRMTDRPHRLKPIDIYTHWYSATKLASLAALEHVYSWVQKQSVTPVYVSRYTRIAKNFYTIHIARERRGFWIGGAKALQELRMPARLGRPDIVRSRGIAGYSTSPNGRFYVHLADHSPAYLSLDPGAELFPYIRTANASISEFLVEGRGFYARLDGTVPVRLHLGDSQGCRARVDSRKSAVLPPDGRLQTSRREVSIRVSCH